MPHIADDRSFCNQNERIIGEPSRIKRTSSEIAPCKKQTISNLSKPLSEVFEKLKIQEEWELKEEWLKPYEFYLRSLAQTIPDCKFQLAEENQMADALVTLAATWENLKKLVI